jgi:hypothetical protein
LIIKGYYDLFASGKQKQKRQSYKICARNVEDKRNDHAVQLELTIASEYQIQSRTEYASVEMPREIAVELCKAMLPDVFEQRNAAKSDILSFLEKLVKYEWRQGMLVLDNEDKAEIEALIKKASEQS